MTIVKCSCGCGIDIEIKPWHKYRRKDRYVHGHNMKNKDMTWLQLEHIKKSQEKWNEFKEKHSNKYLCHCGCEEKIIIKKHHMNREIPKFLQGHHPRITYKGKKHTIKSRIKFSLGHIKEKIFRGFKSKLTKSIRNSSKYIEWRLMVFGRDDYTCQECGERGCYLEAHHINSFKNILIDDNITTFTKALNCEKLWDINNGITYCLECHKKKDKSRR